MNVKAVILAILPSFLRRHAAKVEASPVGSRMARGAFWSLTGTLISSGLNLVAAIIVVRFLGKEGYGELAIILSTTAMFQVFAGFGLGVTATKYVAEFRKKDPEKVGRILALSALVAAGTGAVCAVLLAALAPWLAANMLAAPHLAGLLRVSALLLFLGATNGAQFGALAGFEAFRAIARVNLLAGLATFPLMVGGVLYLGLEGAVWATVASISVNWLLCRLALRKEARQNAVPLRFSGCLQEWRVLWMFSLPALLSGLLVTPVNWVCAAMLVNQPNGYGENGMYGAASQWFGLVIVLPTILAQVVLPVLSEHVGKDDWRRSIRILKVSVAANALSVWPVVIIGCLASPLIMGIYGKGFADGWLTLVVVLLTAGLLAVTAPVGQFLAASGRMWIGLLMNAGWALVFLVATRLLVGWGALGLASARLGAYALHSIWVFAFTYVLIKRYGQRTPEPRVGEMTPRTADDSGLGQQGRHDGVASD